MSNESTTPVWHLHNHALVESTNDLAGQLPGWHAVVAARQTSGRGRYRRTWVSDAGGLWLSAVLPTPGPADRWAILPLAAGWALREMLASLGVSGTRLRWPNDLMIGPAKLAGILVERFNPATAVIGIGINYTNDPAAADPDLAGRVTRLADLVQPLPPREAVLATLLAHLAQAQQRIAAERAMAATQPRPVGGVEDQAHADELLDLDLGLEQPGEQPPQPRGRLGLRPDQSGMRQLLGIRHRIAVEKRPRA